MTTPDPVAAQIQAQADDLGNAGPGTPADVSDATPAVADPVEIVAAAEANDAANTAAATDTPAEEAPAPDDNGHTAPELDSNAPASLHAIYAWIKQELADLRAKA